ncbi:hypothetical protein D9O50_00940 [Oxalobacteraceae bacterium CAVE-383]|nr:hypothetical protein D9O50_00940 [Oxalobacteraceae bacterium CAVE-383]
MNRIQIDRTEAGLLDESQAIEKLADRFSAAKGSILDCGFPDQLAERLAKDFQNLCKLEGHVPRLLWIDLLKCFLRMALPTWLLAHMRLTVSLRDWTLTALGGIVTDDEKILHEIKNRWQGIFHPTQTGSNEISLHIERYVKARIELSLLTYWVRGILGPQSIDATLTVRSTGKDNLSISDWLTRCRQAGENIGLSGDGQSIRTKVIPMAQAFGAWLNPSTKGQGKNIEEFLRILLRLPDSDEDDGYLLTGTKKGGFQRVVVFPGPAVLKTMLYLVAAEKMRGAIKTRGKLVLSDLENHFSKYGVDFASSVGARPQLISELSRLGFLKGSPDAGDSAELIVPDITEFK